MIKNLLILLILVQACGKTYAQSNITFRHLNTSNGLSYLGVVDMCMDKKGNLWIGTGFGLNMFNGKSVEKYFATEYPQLQNSNIVQVTCDGQNRIWVLTVNGNVTIIDEKRQFHRVGIYEAGKFIKTKWIVETLKGKPLLFTASGHLQLNPDISLTDRDSLSLDQFSTYPVQGFDTLQTQTFRQVFYYDDAHYLFIQNYLFYKINYQNQQVEKKYTIPYCTPLTKMEENELLYYDRSTKEIKLFNLATGQISFPFMGLVDQFGKPIQAAFNYAEKIKGSQYILTTQQSGVYIYDHQAGKIYNHSHHFADGTTLGANSTSTLEVSPTGWVFIECNVGGISYFNSHEIINNQPLFIDPDGNGYDGTIAGIATKDNITYYIGTLEGMLEWNRNTNTTQFLNVKDNKGQPLFDQQQINSIVIDDYDQVWITTMTHGIVIIDKNKKVLQQITNSPNSRRRMKLERASRLTKGPDGYIWASGRNGLCKINPLTFEVDNFENSMLSRFDSIFSTPILFTDKNNLWIATSTRGLFHYNLKTDQVVQYTTKNGLINNGIYDLGVDSSKNVYVATSQGLSILFPNGTIKNLTQKDGLLMDRAEGLLLDSHNRMWIGNDIGLACYNPSDSSLVTFDTRHGLSIYGFRVGSYFQTPNGEFVFGTPRGIQYFHPDSLFHKKITLNALIHKIETKDIITSINADAEFHLVPSDKQVTFHFSSVEYSPHVRTYYEYQLSGIDPVWVKIVDQNSVRYNALPPGTYVFRVRISNDNKNWQNAENEVTLQIAAPFYQTWWFQLAAMVSCLCLLSGIIRMYRKRERRQREELETESVIHYFASQINRHKNVDELLWDSLKNCISKMKLEECVIYMLDPERNVLVQKAAYGPKNPKENTILEPIEIPVGQGITGNVAQTNKAEIVNNTEKDPRYIMDDMRRHSEIAVPLSIDGEVIGVIDSEHSHKNFFTQKHLNLLSAVAILMSNQIQRILAEEEKQKARMEVLQNKQKAAESRLMSLRLQMNPHFLFNALNSIQQMILANEEMVATRYLSRFSKLLRSILVHSEKETITLREELEILKLYVELESVRFKEAFTYEIHCEEEIDPDEVKIPTLLIQPFVENAIWHGLMHKEGDRKLKIDFADCGDYVQCVIEDNGIGRAKAREMKLSTGQDKKHTSKGIAVSLERLKAMQHNGSMNGSLEIIDLKDEFGNALGTRVEIKLPIQN